MKIGLDFDGPVADHREVKRAIAKSAYGLEPPYPKGTVIRGDLLTWEEYLAIQKSVYPTREENLRMKAVDGALEHIRLLKDDGHEISVITSRTGEELDIAMEWADRKGASLHFIGVPHGTSKAEVARGLNCFVEDDLFKLVPLVGIVPHLFLFTLEYNEHSETDGIATKVPHWEALYRHITAIDLLRANGQ